jgi:hypothetical protein
LSQKSALKDGSIKKSNFFQGLGPKVLKNSYIEYRRGLQALLERRKKMEKEKTTATCLKDSKEDSLLALDDVFADVFNTLALDGKEIVHADELTDGCHELAPGIEAYQGKERAVVKTWKNSVFRLVLTGLNDQEMSSQDLASSVFGYEAFNYEKQLGKTDGTFTKLAPVITLVLYFGKDKYDDSASLFEGVNTKDTPEELRALYNDPTMHVFDISHMSQEQMDQFASDFKAVAKYLSNQEDAAVLSFAKMEHPQAVQDFLEEILGKENVL